MGGDGASAGRMGNLVLSRRPGETICIGDDVRVTIAELRGGAVRVAVEAPRDVLVLRSELVDGRGGEAGIGRAG